MLLVDDALPDSPGFEDHGFRLSPQSIVVVLAAITVIVLIGWADVGMRAAKVNEPQHYLNLMPRAAAAYYEWRYFTAPALIGSTVHALLSACVIVQVIRRHWRTRSLALLIALLASWMFLVFSLIWISECAMT